MKARSKVLALGITLMLAASAVAVLFMDFPGLQNLPQQSVLAVSQFYMTQDGVGAPGKIVEGGNWRITGTTGGPIAENFTFLTIDNNLAKQYGAYGVKPYNITGSVSMGIFQNAQPYWHIPVSKLADLEVYPKMTGSYKIGASTYTVDALSVSVWGLDLAQKELVIPFTVGVLKTKGANVGSLVPDDPTAKKISSPQGDYYEFSKSFASVAQGQTSSVITFKNPADADEKLVLTLMFTVGGSEFDWNQDWVIVTEKDGGEVTNNVFPRSSWDSGQLAQLLNWKLGSPWSFYHYWFGGGLFAGRAHVDFGGSSAAVPNDVPFSTWSDGSTSPLMVKQVTPPYGTYIPVLDEGYSYPTQSQNSNYQYPGWYVPAPGNTEGLTPSVLSTQDWQNYRLPAAATIHNDRQNLKPDTALSNGGSQAGGLSIVNYVASAVVTPTAAKQIKPTSTAQVNPDFWGYGYSGLTGNNAGGLKVLLPTAARQWLCTIDASTQLVDTIVIAQTFPWITIDTFSVDRNIVGAGEAAAVTVSMINGGGAGYASVGIPLPAAVSGSCSVSDGDGSMYFAAGETKTLTLHVKNTGNLEQDTTATFSLNIDNHQQVVTRTFTLTFLKGLGVPDTTVTIMTLLQDTSEPITDMTVKVFYGITGTSVQTLKTQGAGDANFNFGKYYGTATVSITDANTMRPGGAFKSKQDVIKLDPGANEAIIYSFTHSKDAGVSIWLIAGIAIAVAVGIAVVAVVVKKRGRRNRSQRR